MADLEDIRVECPPDETEQGPSNKCTGKSIWTEEHENSSNLPSGVHGPPDRGSSGLGGGSGQMGQKAEERKGPIPLQEDLRARFYEHYQKEADEYDRGFTKKYDDDLTTTLIFAGLFSAVTSAFIIMIQPELKPDLNEETTALLRVIIYTLNNTSFGGQVPTVQQWTGPPRSIVQVQAILFTSLSASLLSALLATLGKQWWNRCTPVDARGTIIQRGQYRQRKFDGIVNWYFDYTMEALPLMLQASFLLFGCALSRYLWEINTTVASVVLAFTAFGLLFYLSIVIAGAVSEDCPYQTPFANFLRHIPVAISHTPTLLRRGAMGVFCFIRVIYRLVSSTVIKKSWFCTAFTKIVPMIRGTRHTLRDIAAVTFRILLHIFPSPVWLIVDICRAIIRLSTSFAYWVHRAWLEAHTKQITEQRTAAQAWDLRCITWMLHTSVYLPARESALEYLATTTLDDFNPVQFVAGWFEIFLVCIQVTDGNVTIIQGFEWLAEKSSLFCLHMLSHLVVTDPIPKVLEDVRKRYTRIFSSKSDFDGLQVSHTLGVIHRVLHSNPTEDFGNQLLTEGPMRPLFVSEPPRWRAWWNNYQPSSDEHTTVARALTRFAQFEHKKSGRRAKVPRWLLRFALRSLSQDPLPPPSVIFDSLSIIAIDLGCKVPSAVTAKFFDQNAQVERILGLIAIKLKTLADACDMDALFRKRKAINALFTYAVWQERDGEYPILDTFLHIVKAMQSVKFWWLHVQPPMNILLNDAGGVLSKRALLLASPYMPWGQRDYGEDLARVWVVAASAVPKEEEIAPSVVDTLFQIAFHRLLSPSRYGDAWSWLTLRPLLPPVCTGRSVGSRQHVVQMVQNLKDIEILKSYLLLIWSEWDHLYVDGFNKIATSIRQDFGGIEMISHRTDLLQRLDYVLAQLDSGLEHLRQGNPHFKETDLQRGKIQYWALKEMLEVDSEALNVPTQSHPVKSFKDTTDRDLNSDVEPNITQSCSQL